MVMDDLSKPRGFSSRLDQTLDALHCMKKDIAGITTKLDAVDLRLITLYAASLLSGLL